MATMIEVDGRTYAHNPSARGYHVSYREHEVNHCPGCSRTQWFIGRMMAECAFCHTALPLESSSVFGNGTRPTRVRPSNDEAFAA